jgi:hypothetical protein
VISQPSNQDYITANVSDGSGGAIIAWDEDRTGMPIVDASGRRLYAQHLDATGARLWSEMGIPVSAAASAQFVMRIISDGEGGTIVTWFDSRNNFPMIYVQRLDAGGKSLWKADGVQVMDKPLPSDALMISDDDGGTILVWSDNRYSQWSVFAQRIRRNGKLGGPQGPKVVAAVTASAATTAIGSSGQIALLVELPNSGPLKLALHDVTGRRVRAWREEFRESGAQELRFELRDERGQSLRSGLYFLDLAYEGGRMARRIVVQR